MCVPGAHDLSLLVRYVLGCTYVFLLFKFVHKQVYGLFNRPITFYRSFVCFVRKTYRVFHRVLVNGNRRVKVIFRFTRSHCTSGVLRFIDTVLVGVTRRFGGLFSFLLNTIFSGVGRFLHTRFLGGNFKRGFTMVKGILLGYVFVFKVGHTRTVYGQVGVVASCTIFHF